MKVRFSVVIAAALFVLGASGTRSTAQEKAAAPDAPQAAPAAAAPAVTAPAGSPPAEQRVQGTAAPAAAPEASPSALQRGQEAASPGTAAAEQVPTAAVEPRPAPEEPLFVKPLTRIEAGRNDSNPLWSPTGKLIAFERSKGDKKEIVIAQRDGTVLHTVYYQLSEGSDEVKFFFPGVFEEISYNAGIAWSPKEDRFVFMSNGGEGNYDVYLRELSGKNTIRLTDHKEKDGHAHWSPTSEVIVFVSGRTGKGDVYLMDIATKKTTRLTQGGKAHLYPQWSPDGKKLAVIHGSNENHDIYVINDVGKPVESLKQLTRWSADDLRPVWSPDGRKLAFYTNYNEAGDPRLWSLAVIAADGSDPLDGEGLAARIVATDVVPDVERGPAWLPDSARIIYVKDDRQEYNPLYVVDVNTKVSALLKTDTKMNHDVSCAPDGTIAFRAQVNQWDQIYLARLKPKK